MKFFSYVVIFFITINLVFASEHLDMDELNAHINSENLDIKIKGDVKSYDFDKNILTTIDKSTYDVKSLSEKYSMEVDENGIMKFKDKDDKEFTLQGQDVKASGDKITGTFTNINGVETSPVEGSLGIIAGNAVAEVKGAFKIKSVGEDYVKIIGDDISLDTKKEKNYKINGGVAVSKGRVFAVKDSVVNNFRISKYSLIARRGEFSNQPSISISGNSAKFSQTGAVTATSGNKFLNAGESVVGEDIDLGRENPNAWQKLYDLQKQINNELCRGCPGWSDKVDNLIDQRKTLKRNLGLNPNKRISSKEIKRRMGAATVEMQNGVVKTEQAEFDVKKTSIILREMKYIPRIGDVVNIDERIVLSADGVETGGVSLKFRPRSSEDYGSFDAVGKYAKAMAREGYPLTVPFSTRGASHYQADRSGGRRKHKGIDLYAPKGTPVFSMTDGVVSKVAYQRSGAGYYVKVRGDIDGTTWETKYFHLKQDRPVRKGERIKAGQLIGYVSNSGNAKNLGPGGDHLHFEAWRNGLDRPPLDFFSMLHNRRQNIALISD